MKENKELDEFKKEILEDLQKLERTVIGWAITPLIEKHFGNK